MIRLAGRAGRHLVLACVLVIFLGIKADIQRAYAQDPSADAASSQQDEHRVYLPAVINESMPTSFELIERALEREEIDEETALTYKVFAAFGDNRLPEQYKGNDADIFETNIGVEVSAQWDDLSAETQETIGPFMVQPMYEGSWWHLQQTQTATQNTGNQEVPPCQPRQRCGLNWPDWDYVEGPLMKVWYPKHLSNELEPKAQFVRETLNDEIWPPLTEYMAKVPLFDETFPDTDTVIPNNGGDDLLDIALVGTISSKMQVWPYLTPGDTKQGDDDKGCEKRPTYMLVAQDVLSIDKAALKFYLTHELMHSIQYAYDAKADCKDYAWWREASAQWAGYFLYKEPKVHHNYASFYLHRTDRSLNFTGTSSDQVEYGVYLWPFYLHETYPDNDLIRKIWENTEEYDSLEAVERTLDLEDLDGNPGDGVVDEWRKFALLNWNRKPVDDYQLWDGLQQGAKPMTRTVSLHGKKDAEYVLLQEDRKNGLQDETLPPLSSMYYHFEEFGDDARSVLFANGFSFALNRETVNLIPDTPVEGEIFSYELLGDDTKKGRHIWLLTKIGGKWQEPVDVTDRPGMTWCRDMPAERIEELVLIFSNSRREQGEKLGPSQLAPRLWVSNMGCGGWTVSDPIQPSLVLNPPLEGSETASLENIVFERSDAAAESATIDGENEATTTASPVAPMGYQYELTSGTVSFDISAWYETESAICDVTGSDSGALAAGSVHNNLITANYVLGGDAYRGIVLQGFLPSDYMPVSEICHDKETGELVSSNESAYEGPYSAVWPSDVDAGVSEDGTVLAGESVWSTGSSEGSGDWRFELHGME